MFSAVDMLLQYYRLVLSTTADNLHLIIMKSRTDEQCAITRNIPKSRCPDPTANAACIGSQKSRCSFRAWLER